MTITLPRLCERTLSLLPAAVARPAYDRALTRVGVIHFGPGAFHRAHQAELFDRLLAADPRLQAALETAYGRLAAPATALLDSGR